MTDRREATPIETRQDVIEAVLIAAAMLLSIAWWARRAGRREAPEGAGDVPASRGELWLNLTLVLLSAAFMAVTVQHGIVQDYHLYRGMWLAVRKGHDPWFMVDGVFGHYPLNAYGPLFNILAIFDYIHPLLPKLGFAWAYLLFAVGTIKAGRGAGRGVVATAAILAWFWNPYVWVELAHYGHFDVLVGLFCVAAVEARVRRRDVGAGVPIALGVLLKYMPTVLIPFLVIDRGRFRFRLLFVASAVILLGLGASVAVWGPAVFRPIAFAAGRSSEYLSIFRYLRGVYSPITEAGAWQLDRWAGPVLLVALLRAWSWSRLRGTEPASAAVLAILTTLLFYQVGFPQYQMVLFVLASYWIKRTWHLLTHHRLLITSLACYFAWIATFTTIESVWGVAYRMMHEWAGLPTFLLGSLLLVAIVLSSPIETPGEVESSCAAQSGASLLPRADSAKTGGA